MLEAKGANRLFYDALMRQDDFEKMSEHLDDYLQAQQELPDIRADIDTYCQKIKGPVQPLGEIIALFEATEHDAFIKDIVKYLILNKENKANSVLIHGAPNGGKTQFLIRLGQILDVVYYKQTRSNFDCRYKGGKKAPAFVICEEGCLGKLFDPKDQYVNAKLFLEGQGLMVEQKCRHPKEKWSGVPVILTTNKVPKVMRLPQRQKEEKDYEYQERWNNYMAFMTRCRMTQINHSHKNSDEFPYDAD